MLTYRYGGGENMTYNMTYDEVKAELAAGSSSGYGGSH